MLNAADLVEKKYQPLPHISTYNMVTKPASLDDKSKPNIYDGQYFDILMREGDTLVVRYEILALGVQLFYSTKGILLLIESDKINEPFVWMFQMQHLWTRWAAATSVYQIQWQYFKTYSGWFFLYALRFRTNDLTNQFYFATQRRHYGLMQTIKMEKNIKTRTPRFEKQRPNKKMKVEIKSVWKCHFGEVERRVTICFPEFFGWIFPTVST